MPSIPRDRLPFTVGQKEGYLDRNFKVVISAEFRYAGEFIDGVAEVFTASDQAPRFIDKTGRTVFDARLSANDLRFKMMLFSFGPRVERPSDGLVLMEVYGVRQDFPDASRFGFKNLRGDWVVDPDFDEASSFSEGLAAVSVRDESDFTNVRAGFIRTNGTFAIKPMFKDTRAFSDGVAVVEQLDGRKGVIDKTGKLLFSSAYELIGSYAHGLAVAKRGKADYVFVRKDGTVLPAPRASFATPFSEDLAAVLIGGRDEFDRIEPYNISGGHWGYLDKSGQLAIAAAFDWACPFSEGLAAVNVGMITDAQHSAEGGRWGYIDRTGAWVLKPQFSRAESFADGVAGVKIGGRDAYIDSRGNVLWMASSK